MLQEKICRGQDKARSISGCGHLVKVEYRKYGLCPSCFSDFLNTDIGKPLLNNSIKRGQKKIQAEAEEAVKTQKKAIRTNVVNWKDKLQKEVQKIARLIDSGLLCPVRPNAGQQLQGGHVWSKKSNPEIRFDLNNIHRQSAQSNCFEADALNFIEAIAKEYGQDYVDFVKSQMHRPIPKLSQSEYQQIYYKARKISNELSKENRTYSLEERIEKRNEINLELNIYSESQCVFKRKAS